MEETHPITSDTEEASVLADRTDDKSPADDVMDVDNEIKEEAVNETVKPNERDVDMETDNINKPEEDSVKNQEEEVDNTNQHEDENSLRASNQEDMAGIIKDITIPDSNDDNLAPNEKTSNVSESKSKETEDSSSIIPSKNKEHNDSEDKLIEPIDDASEINNTGQDIEEAVQSSNSEDTTSNEIRENKNNVSEILEPETNDIPVEEEQASDETSKDTTTSCINNTLNKNKAEESESIEDVQKYIDDTSNSNEAGDKKSGAENIDIKNIENKLELDNIEAKTNDTTLEVNDIENVSSEPSQKLSSDEIPNETPASSDLKLNEVDTDNQVDDTLQKLSDDLEEGEEKTKNAVECVNNAESKIFTTLENMEIDTEPENKETENPVNSELDISDSKKLLSNSDNTNKPPLIPAISKTQSAESTKKQESPKRRTRRNPVIPVMPNLHYLDNETNFSGFYPEYYDSTIYMYRGYWCYVQEEFNIPSRPLPPYKTSFYLNYMPSTQPVVHTSSGRVVKKKEMKDFTPSVPNSHQMKKEKESVQSSGKKDKEIPSTPKKAADDIYGKKEIIQRKYRLPLEKYGWKREIVFRSSAHSPAHTADVYYYSPKGRKLRSIREIIDTLPEDDELKPFHFTFVKEPLGFEPPLEVSREAISRTLTSCDEDTPKRGRTPKNFRKVFFDKNNSNVLSSSGGKPKPETPKVNGKLKKQSLSSAGVKRTHDDMENDKTQVTPVKTSTPTVNTAKSTNGDVRKTPDHAESVGKPSESPVKHKPQGEVAKKVKLNSNTSKTVNSHTINKHGGDHKKPQSDGKTSDSVKTKHKASDISVHAPSNKKQKVEAPPVVKMIHSNKNLVNDVSNQFNAIVHLCKYLRVEDLLRVARVNRLFNAAAHSYQLWQVVKLKNSKVRDWTGLADCLNRHRTHTLDMLKMIGSADPDENDEIWNRFYKVIGKIHSLKRLELGRVTAAEILNSASNCSKNLTEFSVIAQKLATIDLKLFQGLPNLEILQLRSFESKREHGLIMMNIPLLSNMKNLRHLSLTGVKNLKSYQVNVLKDFPPLTSLELGDCTKLDERFPEASLAPLTSLVRLRLEMVQGNMANKFIEVIATLPRLKTLELINIDTKKGFDEVFGRLSHIEHLLIFPTYITQSSTTNWLVLSGLAKLKSSLKFLTWGLTQELLRVTTLFIEQWNAQLNLDDGVSKLDPEELKKTIVESNSIPVMKPLPELFEAVHTAGKVEGSKQNISELDILPIDELKAMLEKVLYDTKIKLITVPVSSTTRIYLPSN
ncbi:hypothetical protein WDU94_010496 [Cyamophila willieti]